MNDELRYVRFIITGLSAGAVWFGSLFLFVFIVEVIDAPSFDQPLIFLPYSGLSWAFTCWFISGRQWAVAGRWSCLIAFSLFWIAFVYVPLSSESSKFDPNVLGNVLYCNAAQAIAFFFGDLGDRTRTKKLL